MATTDLHAKPILRDGLPLVSRAMPVRQRSYDAETREFDLVASTGAGVRRYDWATGREYEEVLDLRGADLGRMNAGGPILDSHSSRRITDTVGAIVPDSARVVDGQLVARGRLSSADDVAPVRARLEDGTIGSMSIGYTVEDQDIVPADKKAGRSVEVRTATRWTVYEVSLVAIPADAGAGVRSAAVRQVEQKTMSDVIDIDAARNDAAKAERARASAIATIARKHGLDLQASIDDGSDVATAQARALDMLAAKSAQTETAPAHSGAIRVGASHDEQRAEGIANALQVRAGAKGVALTPAGRAHANVDLYRLAEDCVRAQGLDPRDYSARSVAELALSARRGVPMTQRSFAGAMSTGDFPLILANVANKFLLDAFAEEPMTHEAFTYDRAVRDTKQISIVSLGSIDALPVVAEGAEYTYANIGEAREVYQLAKYGQIAPLTVETVLNDDLGAFTRLVGEMGRAAMRAEKGLIYGTSGVLGSNSGAGQTMAAHGAIAAAALHHTTHANTGTTGALSATTLAEMRRLLLKQTDENGNIIGGLMPSLLLVPAALYDTAEILQQQRFVAATASNATAAWMGGLKVIVEPRLDTISATGFYLMTGRKFVERARLQGEPAPVVSTIEQPEADQIGYKVRYWCATKASDWRDTTFNIGA